MTKNGILREGGGRPKDLVDADYEELSLACEEYKAINNVWPSDDRMRIMLQAQAEKAAASRGQLFTRNLTHNTLDRGMNNKILKCPTAQKKSEARAIAENDPMTCLSTISMWHYILQSVTRPCNVLNIDATQFGFVKNLDKPPRVVMPVKCDGEGKPVSTTANNNKDLVFFVKYFCMITLSGFIDKNLVFLLADSRLSEDEMHVYKVPLLSLGTSADDFGYVVFTKTRGGNNAFFTWFAETVMVEFIKILVTR